MRITTEVVQQLQFSEDGDVDGRAESAAPGLYRRCWPPEVASVMLVEEPHRGVKTILHEFQMRWCNSWLFTYWLRRVESFVGFVPQDAPASSDPHLSGCLLYTSDAADE